uniref:Uncharacterized protein n=1 Tax=Siphoviridae sp. ctTXt1 TaxID=2825520 RepID=A0A8S5P9Z3_9CAUD|nr:MAG TPA: hypothetical protein [Siphoviridae sp. ctTXt1]DAZ37805.1 MAG TPA: hypothetical protein [Caudoviricetes sp.]
MKSCQKMIFYTPYNRKKILFIWHYQILSSYL